VKSSFGAGFDLGAEGALRMGRIEDCGGARRAGLAAALILAAALSACSGFSGSDWFSRERPPPPSTDPANAIGSGHVKVGLVLPLSASGNAALAAQSLKNSAEMALAEFNNPDLQLLVKDDAGTAAGAQQATQQAVDEGAAIILGPLFAVSVGPAGQTARGRGVPVIAFSTDASVASRGVYLLSFLPESDVDRLVEYAVANGKRSFAAIVPESAYGNVVDAEFRQEVARKGGRIVAAERYPADRERMQEPVRRVAEAARQADAIFIPDSAEAVPAVVQALAASGVDPRKVQLTGTGLWDDPRVFAEASLQGGWYAAPESSGYRNFSTRYRKRFGQDPLRTATLAYDAVSLVAALAKTQGAQRFSAEALTTASGFSGVDGIFRFRPDGTNQRGLAVLRVTSSGGQVISPPPKSFGGPAT
jgi:branched-chain amino acid transport system substrate-binding protein